MINSKDLLAALRFCKHALPKADKRAQLHGIWLSTYDGKLCIEASDGRSLARCTLDVPELVAGTVTSIRTDNLAAVEARLVHGDETIMLAELQARQQINGARPDFERIWEGRETPKPLDKIGLDVARVGAATRAAIVICEPKYKGAWLTMHGPDDGVVFVIPTAANPYPSMTDDAHYLVMPMRL